MPFYIEAISKIGQKIRIRSSEIKKIKKITNLKLSRLK